MKIYTNITTSKRNNANSWRVKMKSIQLKKIINDNVKSISPQLGEMNMSFYLYENDLGMVRIDVIKERQGIRLKLDGSVVSAKKFDSLNFKVKK